MATESVKILIEAEDQASASIAAAAKQMKAQEQAAMQAYDNFEKIKKEQLQLLELERIALDKGEEAAESMRLQMRGLDKATADLIAREKALIAIRKQEGSSFKSTKATAEFLGTVSSLGGGGIIGQIAGQIGQLTEKTSQFGEVAEQGKAGALAFKVGLASVVGVLGFQVGNALGNMIFETDKWNKELEKSIDLSKKITGELNRLADIRLGDSLRDIQLIEDPESQIAKIKELRDKAGNEVSKYAAFIKKKQDEIRSNEVKQKITGGFATSFFAQNDTERIQREIEENVALKEAANARFLALDKQIGDASKQIDTDKLLRDRELIKSDTAYLYNLDAQIAMLKALKDDESGLAAIKEQAAQSVSESSMEAARQKLQQIELLKQEIDLEKKAKEEKKAALKEIADLEFNSVMAAEKAFIAERDRLAEQKVLLEQGAEAAHAMRLAKQGISEEDAKSFAAQQAELDNQKQVQEKMKARESTQPLQAVSSRFLTRGPIDDKMLDVAKSQLKVQQEQLAELKKPKPEGPKTRDVRIVEVG